MLSTDLFELVLTFAVRTPAVIETLSAMLLKPLPPQTSFPSTNPISSSKLMEEGREIELSAFLHFAERTPLEMVTASQANKDMVFDM